jgi:hypothetical protein
MMHLVRRIAVKNTDADTHRGECLQIFIRGTVFLKSIVLGEVRSGEYNLSYPVLSPMLDLLTPLFDRLVVNRFIGKLEYRLHVDSGTGSV